MEVPRVRVDDYFPKGAFRSAQQLVNSGRPKEAIALLKRLLRKHPDAPQGNEARFLLALSMLQLGEYEDAASLFEELAVSYPALRDDHLFYRGEALYLFGNYLQAATVLADVDPEGPRSVSAARLRAWALYKSTDFERLITWLEADAKEEGDRFDSELLFVLGKARHRSADGLGAYRAFREVWQRAPSGRLAGQALVELAKVKTGARNALSPSEAAAVMRLKNRILNPPDFDRAMAELERTLGRSKTSRALRAEVAAARGRAAKQAGKAKDALAHFVRARTLAPVDMAAFRAAASIEEARTLLGLGNEVGALRAFDSVAERFSGRKEAEESLFQSADILLRSRKYHAAEERCSTLLERNPDSTFRAECLWSSAWAEFRLGEYDKAEGHFDELARLDLPAELHAASTYWLGRTKSVLGKSDEARDAFARVLERYPLNYYAALAEDQMVTPLSSSGNGTNPGTATTVLPDALTRVQEYLRLGLREKAARALLAFERTVDAEDMKLDESALQFMTRAYGDLRMFEDARRLREACARLYPRGLGDHESMRLAKQAHPLKYEAEIRAAAREFGVSEYLLFGLIRTESGFKADAVSSMNAYGLAQLILPTASHMAKQIKAGPVSRARLLYNPALNVRLGAKYVRTLLDRYDGMEPLAIAAYNAGPAAVDSWARRRVRALTSVKGGGLGVAPAPDELAEEITVAETRAFVKSVLARARSYAVLYGAPAAPGPRLPELSPTLVSGPLSEPVDVPGARDLSRALRIDDASKPSRRMDRNKTANDRRL